MKIILTGGGTLGSVSPLLAVSKELKDRDAHIDILWIGTKNGPEKELVLNYGFNYKYIHCGKLRRYFSIKNITDLFKTLTGFLQSIYIVSKYKPNIIIGAGGFVQVPLIYASKLISRNIKIIIHQQDIKPGLANKLCEKLADKITVSTKKSLLDFDRKKTIFTGNPYRKEILNGSVNKAIKMFNITPKLPIILIMGGGTGALKLNKLTEKALPYLTKFSQIIHLTGKGKINKKLKNKYKNYKAYEFLKEDIKHAYSVADIIISRAGFSSLTEISVLAKPAIIIPIPNTHQEENAKFWEENQAVIRLNQEKITLKNFINTIKKLIKDDNLKFSLSFNISKMVPKNSTENFISEIQKLAQKSGNIKITKWTQG